MVAGIKKAAQAGGSMVSSRENTPTPYELANHQKQNHRKEMFLKMPSAGHNGDSLDEWALTLFVDVLVSFLKEKRHIIPRRGPF